MAVPLTSDKKSAFEDQKYVFINYQNFAVQKGELVIQFDKLIQKM